MDELHTYRGVFDGHFSLIMWRLQRVVALYRTVPPSYLFGSATIGISDGHTTQLLLVSIRVSFCWLRLASKSQEAPAMTDEYI